MTPDFTDLMAIERRARALQSEAIAQTLRGAFRALVGLLRRRSAPHVA